ncbi:MAG: ribosome maturation factor RimM [Clostridia bacterium]
MKQFFEIGRITDVHGLQGAVKVLPITDDLDNLKRQEFFHMGEQCLLVEWMKPSKDRIIMKFKGIDTREKSELLKGRFLSISRENAAPLKEDTYYIEDIIGCEVYEEGVFIGRVENVIVTGSNDVYHVMGKDKEILVPAMREYIRFVDIAGRRIDVCPLKGLSEND